MSRKSMTLYKGREMATQSAAKLECSFLYSSKFTTKGHGNETPRNKPDDHR